MSDTPVREAVNDLVALGVLENRSGVGVKVVNLTMDEFASFQRFRSSLEGFAAHLLAEWSDRAALDGLRREAEAVDGLAANVYQQFNQCGAVSRDSLVQ